MIKFNQNNLEELKQDLIDQDMIIFEDEDENKQTLETQQPQATRICSKSNLSKTKKKNKDKIFSWAAA
jgi:hypothetical protein